ncbi:hypothetical protein LZ009_10425 [Ramlibacter sp. XY19]|uniref:hypothetical protein n=1 Tax=Ramlibacter paludis TaxID=2908000 RepID=UPI0023DABA6B|nr:hypothetical protein [Ramlibacter paludis]MCG2593195.1 hypothetical protein [Ramlibacter paludis]
MALANLDPGTVELPSTDGVPFVGTSSPLTRLHYFDGQFLRASALTLEQDYHRQAVRLGNLAGGWGVVHGLGISLEADQLVVGDGLAVTPAGSFVLAPQAVQAKLAELLQVATPPPPAGAKNFADCLQPKGQAVALGSGIALYEITVGPIEGLCGNEPVYGKLCDSACATDSRHPYWREGLVLRLRPVTLALPTSSAVAHANVHLRNRVASAYFAAEPWLTQSLLSAAGLASDTWCRPCELYGRDEVVIGLLAREGATVRVIDAWSGRRERMDTQARGYWQGRMAMRPWNVFLAQILQFQCQLAGLFDPDKPVILPDDDCEGLRDLLGKARRNIEDLVKRYGASTQKIMKQVDGRPTISQFQNVSTDIKGWFADLDVLSTQLAGYVPGQGALPRKRMLLNAGFFELPPAGYLPVSLNADVQEQVERMFGEGVQLHFHGVAADEIAHLVEEAQHMKRISLTRGLDDPAQLEPVEIFVPDAQTLCTPAPAEGTWWRAHLALTSMATLGGLFPTKTPAPTATPKPTGTPVPTPPPATAPPAATPPPIFKTIGDVFTTVLDKVTTTGEDVKTTVADGAAEAGDKVTEVVTDTGAKVVDGATEVGKEIGNAVGNATGGLPFGAPQMAARKTTTRSRASAPPQGAPAPAPLRASMQTGAGLGTSRLPLAFGTFDGLARTENHADGSSGFAMVLANDLLQDANNQVIAETLRMKAVDGNLEQALRMAIYLAGDIDKGVFGLQIGDMVRMPVEMRMVLAGRGGGSSVDGKLTVLAKRTRSDGSQERLVQMDLGLTSLGSLGIIDGAQSFSLRILLRHDGDERTGSLVVDDEQQDPKSPPLHFDWDDSPRRAVLFTEEVTSYNTFVANVSQRTRNELLDMTGLPAMPPADSAIAIEAMNALAAIADAGDDAAFLVRARRRLFPQLQEPRTQRVVARRDWVMFRRARTHVCCPPACAPAPAAATETFQVWHLKLPNSERLEAIARALEQGDAAVLSRLPFKRVGLLRYRDESAFSEEPAERVLALWQLQAPAAQVALARSWEIAPEAGQGWQNHMRLRHMLEQIRTLTQPPARGSGAVGTIAPPPGILGDGAYDGGMLVVTMPQQAVAVGHRVVMLMDSMFSRVVETFKGDAAKGWDLLQRLLTSTKEAVVADLSFIDGTLSAEEVNELMAADESMRNSVFPGGLPAEGFRLDAATIPVGVNAPQQHVDVLKVLDTNIPDLGSVTVPATDLGAGAVVLTLVRYVTIG